MPIVTDIQAISNTISNIIDFVSTNEKVKTDFDEYLQTIGAVDVTPQQMQVLSIPYITERILYKQESKTVPELYLQETKKLSDLEKEIVLGLNNTISSVFEIIFSKISFSSFVSNDKHDISFTISSSISFTK